MIASGAIAGMIGTHLVVGETYRFLDGDLVVSGFAWTGLLVALLARHRPGPILAAGAFFAALQIGGLAMQRNVNVPWQIAQVLQAVVIIMIAGRFVLKARRESAVGHRRRDDCDRGSLMFEQLFDSALVESVVRALIPILLAALGGLICDRGRRVPNLT